MAPATRSSDCSRPSNCQPDDALIVVSTKSKTTPASAHRATSTSLPVRAVQPGRYGVSCRAEARPTHGEARVADKSRPWRRHEFCAFAVKPKNLFLTETDRCMVGDFGFATLTDPAPGRARMLGVTATAVSDVYSLGATLYWLSGLIGSPTEPSSRKLERSCSAAAYSSPVALAFEAKSAGGG